MIVLVSTVLLTLSQVLAWSVVPRQVWGLLAAGFDGLAVGSAATGPVVKGKVRFNRFYFSQSPDQCSPKASVVRRCLDQ